MTRLLSWVAGALAGILVALPAALIPQNDPPSADWDPFTAAQGVPPGDYVTSLADGVRADHFWASPEVAGRLTDQQITDLSRMAGDSQVPLFVAFVGDHDIAPEVGTNTNYATLDQLMVSVGQDGYYAVIDSRGSAVEAGLGYRDPYVDSSLLNGRLDQGLDRYLTALGEVEPEAPYSGSDSDYWGGLWGGIGAGLLMVIPAFLVLLAIVAIMGVIIRFVGGDDE